MKTISIPAPDFGMILLESGATALLWAVVRTALVWQALRSTGARPAASVAIGASARA